MPATDPSRSGDRGITRKVIPLAFLVAFFLGGCAHYQLGTPKIGYSSIYVRPVINHSLAPQAQALLTTNLAHVFERDGRLSLQTRSNADLVLTTVLTRLQRQPRVASEQDTGLARKFVLTLTVKCTLTDRATGKILFKDRQITATTEEFVGASLVQSEYQAMPVLTRNLAQSISHAVLDVW